MRSFIFVILIRYSCCYDDQIKKHEMGGAHSARVGNVKYVKNLGWKA
jgi:hypothetical protein